MKHVIDIQKLDIGYMVLWSDMSIEYLTQYELEERIKLAVGA